MNIGWSALNRRMFQKSYSYNGAATTTILFPRLNIGTGSDANPQANPAQGLVVGHVPMRLRRLTINNNNVWGVTTITLRVASLYTSYSDLAVMTTTALVAGANVIEFTEDHVINPGQIVAVGFTPDGAQHGYSVGLLDFTMLG